MPVSQYPITHINKSSEHLGLIYHTNLPQNDSLISQFTNITSSVMTISTIKLRYILQFECLAKIT